MTPAPDGEVSQISEHGRALLDRAIRSRTDQLVVVLVLLGLLDRVGPAILQFFAGRFASTEGFAQAYMLLRMMSAACSLALGVAIAVWLYRHASREGRSAWVWCLFGLLFQVIAVAVYLTVPMWEARLEQPDARHSV